jgi:septum site-determining protein MinC
MGRRRVQQQRLYPSRAAECTSAAAGLKRLTRAELITIIAKLERQASSSDRDECVADKVVSRHAPTMLLNESVRSGQRLTFAEGDLIIVGSVGSGAEIVAGGSIHIYGALRGRAYAGTSDHLDTSLRGRAAHAWRAANNIELAALSKLADSHSHPESREAVASLELRQAIIENSQGSRRALGQNRTARFGWARPLDWIWRLTSTKYGTTGLKARADEC